MATDGVRYSDFSPLPADQLAGDEKFVGLKNGVNVRLEGDWRGPMADLLRPSLMGTAPADIDADGYSNVSFLSTSGTGVVSADRNNAAFLGNDGLVTITLDAAAGRVEAQELMIGGELILFPQNNLSATTDPGVNDDSSEGYSVLSKWINTIDGEVFVCVDATDGAAVWQQTTVDADDLGNLAFINGSTVGLNLAQLPTPGDASWARVNDDGTVSLRTAAQTLSDLGASSGMSNPMTTEGDLIVGGASGAPERLGIGSNGQVLSVSGGGLSWEDAGAASGGLYRGPWEDQTGEAVPPYWVDYGGGENKILYSEGLDQSGTWTRTGLVDVTDSGIAAPTIDGQSFGNYWKVISSTQTEQHSINQSPITAPSSGEMSFLFRSGGYSEVFVRLDTSISNSVANFAFNSDDGVLSSFGFTEVTAQDLGGGDFLLRAKWESIPGINRTRIFPSINGSATEPGNGTDGILITRVQVSSPGARYVKTTDAPAPYTPPKIYELQAPVDAIENEDDPITDGGTLWKEVGSGGGGGGASTATAPEQVFTSADQDGSSNIAVELDASEYTEWQLDFNGSPLPSTSGAYNINIANLPDSIDNVQFFHIRMKRAGRKTVNLTATNESSTSLTVSWLEAPEFLATSGAWDMVTLHRWPANPNILFASLNDGRV